MSPLKHSSPLPLYQSHSEQNHFTAFHCTTLCLRLFLVSLNVTDKNKVYLKTVSMYVVLYFYLITILNVPVCHDSSFLFSSKQDSKKCFSIITILNAERSFYYCIFDSVMCRFIFGFISDILWKFF